MRRDVKKYLFVGVLSEKDSFFQKAQELGIIEFINKKKGLKAETSTEIQKILTAIKVLRGLPVLEQEELLEGEPLDHNKLTGVVKDILYLRDLDEKFKEERRMLRQEIARIEIFGQFSLEDIESVEKLGNRKVQFYCSKKHKGKEFRKLPENIIYVDSDHGLDYFIGVNKEKTAYDGMIEINIHRSTSDLQQRMEEVKKEIHTAESSLKKYEKYNDLLHKLLTEQLNDKHLSIAKEATSSELEGSLFAVEGWAPENKGKALLELLEEKDVHFEEVAIKETDKVPTFLENSEVSRIGEDLVHIYDTPSITDKDPSLWVLVAFSIFFAVILGDGGYGLLLLALTGFLYKKYSAVRGAGKRALRLMLILSSSCVIWGVLTSSFFGMSFDLDNPIRKASALNWLIHKKMDYHILQKDETYTYWVQQFPSVKEVTDPGAFLSQASKVIDGKVSYQVFDKFSDNILLEFALFVGAIHTILGFLRYIRKNWTGIGWIAFVVGGYLYVPGYLDATSFLHFLGGVDKQWAAEAGYYLMLEGIGLAVLIGLIQDKLFGLLEVMNVIQIFADILSYLRLYALGLAGAIVSQTVNEMAGSVTLAAGIIILIIGHSINILLSIMGGVIHGLRLNFLEWYHYCFEGGGKLFSPLVKVETD